MNILVRSFIEPSKKIFPAFSCGFLAFILLLLACAIRLAVNQSPSYPYPYGGVAIVILLLFNHLAYSFRFPIRVTVALRVFALVWLVVSLIYVFNWARFEFSRP